MIEYHYLFDQLYFQLYLIYYDFQFVMGHLQDYYSNEMQILLCVLVREGVRVCEIES